MNGQALVLVLVFVAACQPASPEASRSPSVIGTQGPSVSLHPTANPSAAATPMVTPLPTPTAQLTVTPGPTSTPTLAQPVVTIQPTRTIEVASHEIQAPITARASASGVWTGAEVIVWGGIELTSRGDHLRSDGAAYNPSEDRWRVIADGPLSERQLHLAVWTGREMLIWGGNRLNYIEPPDGAAYDPAADRWREIAKGPLEWRFNATGIWTGSEWVIAVTDGRAERTDLAAYDPASDQWRSLPSLSAESGDEKDFAWTGEQLVLREQGGTFQRLPPDGGAWIAVDPVPGGFPVIGPIHWTGQEVVGTATEFLGTDEPRYRGHLVAWDPVTETWEFLASSTNLGGFLVPAGERAILLGGGLAYDPASRSLWSLPTPWWSRREDAVIVWAGDRLFTWGGGIGHPPMSYEDGFILTPDW